MRPDWKILIVDDNPTDRMVLRAMLTKLGFRNITEAENGAIGDAKIKMGGQISRPFELIFIDWQMPTLNGIQLLKQLRSTPGTKESFVIMVTGNAEKEVVEEAIKAGVDDFLVKPLSHDVVEAKVKSLISR